MEYSCSDMSDDDGEIKLIFHGKHEHPLIRAWLHGKCCRNCGERFYGIGYECIESCRFYLHRYEECTGDPDEVETPLHPHPLRKRGDNLGAGSRCNCCFLISEPTSTVFYECSECEFSLDKQCALSIKALPEDGAEQIDHPLHSHRLTSCGKFFWELCQWEDPNCKLCDGPLSYHPSYGCRECGFFLHEVCAKLPERLPCRIHPSETLKRNGEYREEFKCHSCGSISSGFPYRCNLCGLDLDYQCVFLRLSATKSWIKAGFHDHALTLYQIGEYKGFECSVCGNNCCTGSAAFACEGCGVFAHQSCADSASPVCEVQHPFHPAHPLIRCGVFNFKCDSCLMDRFGKVGYGCLSCKYYLDHACASPFGVLLLHDIHPHHLGLIDRRHGGGGDDDKREEVTCCTVCHDACAGPTYNCPDCKLFFHKTCADSEEMQHPSHPFHRLRRRYYFRARCHSCLEHRDTEMMYGCEECDFYIDYDCVFKKPVQYFESKQLILSSFHRHPLELVTGGETPDDGIRHCVACYQQCPLPAYRCLVCDIYAHKSCAAAADIPAQIEHPFFHPDHTLIRSGPGRFECRVCQKDRSGLYYKCLEWNCSFTLDATCASLQWISEPFVIYQGHEHPLVFRDRTVERRYIRCNACSLDLTTEDEEPLVFACSICEFYLHFLCGPLPRTIRQEMHEFDTLLLMDSVTDDENGGEIYCHSCEEPRDPCGSVYYCARRHYSAEIKCVMPELKLAFSGKFGDLDLRTLGRWSQSGKLFSKGLGIEEFLTKKTEDKPNKVSRKEIIESLTDDEKIELDGILSCREKLFEFTGRTGCADGPITVFDREFEELMAALDSTELSSLKESWSDDDMFVQVGESLVPERWVRVYNALHQKYGDLSPESGLSSRLKPLLFFHLCWTVHEMCTTKVVHVKEKELTDWCVAIKALRRAGFRIQFAIDALRKAVPAYFGARALEYEADLIKNIPNYEKKIRKKEAKREAIREKLRNHLDYFESGGTSRVKECIEEALILRYKTASDVFFDN